MGTPFRIMQASLCRERKRPVFSRAPASPALSPITAVVAVTDRRNGAGDDRHNGASVWQAERTSREA